MLRIPTALLIAAALAVCLAAFVGGHAAGGLTRGHHDNHAGTRGQVLSLLASHYYRRVDAHLLDGRTLGELPSTLRDPYTKVLSPAPPAPGRPPPPRPTSPPRGVPPTPGPKPPRGPQNEPRAGPAAPRAWVSIGHSPATACASTRCVLAAPPRGPPSTPATRSSAS